MVDSSISSDTGLPVHLENRFIKLGLLNKNPVKDLGILFCLLPVWWFMGVESIILPIGCILIFLKVLAIQRGLIYLPTPLKWMSGFLAIYAISGAFIVESFRWITFIRNFSVFITALLIACIVVNSAIDWLKIKFIVKVIVIVAGLSGLVGLLGILDIWRPTIISILGRFLPDWIANTNYGRTIVFRKLGNLGYYQMVGYYFRLNSFYAYSILYASTLAYTIPIVYYFRKINHQQLIKNFINVLLVTLIINLIFTTGRIAIFGLIVGAVYYSIFVIRRTRRFRIPIIILLSVVIFVLFVVSFVNLEQISSIEEVSDITYFLFYGRGASTSQRLYVYQETLKGWMQSPIFGWGTERDIPDFKYPAGSHSFYLGLLYRQGILGLLAFSLVIVGIWRNSKPRILSKQASQEVIHLNWLLEIGRWVFIAAIVDAITTDPILDITTMSILWLIFGSLLAANQVINKKWGIQLVPITI